MLLIWCLTTTFVLDAIRIYQVIYYVLYCPILLDEGFKLKWGQKKKKTSDKDKAFCPTWDKKIRADTLTYTSLKLDWSMKVLGYSNSHEYNLPIIGWLWGDVILILIIFVKKLLYHVQNYAFIRVLMTETYICNQTNSCMPCEYYLTKVKSSIFLVVCGMHILAYVKIRTTVVLAFFISILSSYILWTLYYQQLTILLVKISLIPLSHCQDNCKIRNLQE